MSLPVLDVQNALGLYLPCSPVHRFSIVRLSGLNAIQIYTYTLPSDVGNRPSSASPHASPGSPELPSSLPIESRNKASPKQPAKSPLTTPNRRTEMSQSSQNSSPLSSPPDTPAALLAPVLPGPPAHDPSLLAPDSPSTRPQKDSPKTTPQSSSGGAPVSAVTTTSNTDSTSTSTQSPKRIFQGDDVQEATPPRKRHAAAKPRAKAIPAQAPKSTEKPSSKTKSTARKSVPRKLSPSLPSLSTRPSRNRKAPDRPDVVENKPTPKPTPTKKGAGKVFDPAFITTNSTSRLVKADVYHMLLETSAWTSLTLEQQTTLTSMLLQDAANKALLGRIKSGDAVDTRPQAFTLSNDCFRTDVAKFKEDLKNGHLAKTWQGAAKQAVIERAAGDFDAWKAEEAELWWGQKAEQNEH